MTAQAEINIKMFKSWKYFLTKSRRANNVPEGNQYSPIDSTEEKYAEICNPATWRESTSVLTPRYLIEWEEVDVKRWIADSVLRAASGSGESGQSGGHYILLPGLHEDKSTLESKDCEGTRHTPSPSSSSIYIEDL